MKKTLLAAIALAIATMPLTFAAPSTAPNGTNKTPSKATKAKTTKAHKKSTKTS